tara:strand:- start:135 stop:785 length:651 start_codon:yes stop_codon:yes gene_type:complete
MKNLLTILLLAPIIAFAQQALEVSVLDDKGAGVQSDLTMHGKTQGRTDADGRKTLAMSCEQTTRIQATPINPYYSAGYKACAPNQKSIAIKVTADEYYANLKENLERFEAESNFASIAIVKTEIAARTVDPVAAADLRTGAYRAMGEYLRISSEASVTVIPGTKRYVASPEFVEALKNFQVQNNLPTTGKLDYLTLQKASNRTASELLFNPSPTLR